MRLKLLGDLSRRIFDRQIAGLVETAGDLSPHDLLLARTLVLDVNNALAPVRGWLRTNMLECFRIVQDTDVRRTIR